MRRGLVPLIHNHTKYVVDAVIHDAGKRIDADWHERIVRATLVSTPTPSRGLVGTITELSTPELHEAVLIQTAGKLDDVDQTDVAFSALHNAYIVSVQIGQLGYATRCEQAAD